MKSTCIPQNQHISSKGYTIDWMLDLRVGWGEWNGVEMGDIEET